MTDRQEPPRDGVALPSPRPVPLPDWRCHTCGALLARLKLSAGVVEIKCRNCNTVNVREAA